MSTFVRPARAEWGPLYLAVRSALAARGPWAIPMTLGAVCTTAVFQFVQNQSWGYRFIQDIGSVRPDDPLGPALLRTPLSVFVPALDLPVWGALLQILVVFGIAELCLGWRRALGIVYVATLAGTLYARVGVMLGPDSPFGLPWSDGQVVDRGPSAAVVGLAVRLAWRYEAHWTAWGVTAAMVVEVLVKENLAGKEHLAAIVGVGVVWGASAACRPAQRRLGILTGPGSGLPPMRS